MTRRASIWGVFFFPTTIYSDNARAPDPNYSRPVTAPWDSSTLHLIAQSEYHRESSIERIRQRTCAPCHGHAWSIGLWSIGLILITAGWNLLGLLLYILHLPLISGFFLFYCDAWGLEFIWIDGMYNRLIYTQHQQSSSASVLHLQHTTPILLYSVLCTAPLSH